MKQSASCRSSQGEKNIYITFYYHTNNFVSIFESASSGIPTTIPVPVDLLEHASL